MSPGPARAVNLRQTDYDTYIGRPRYRDRRPLARDESDALRQQARSGTAALADLDRLVQCYGFWGNPWQRGETADPIAAYRQYLEYRIRVGHITPDRIRTELVGKRLGCFCKPQPCHGDVLAELANNNAA